VPTKPLNDFNTSSYFLRKKNVIQILKNAIIPTYLRLVSIFSKESLMNKIEVTNENAAAWRIIHYEILYTDLPAFVARINNNRSPLEIA
jgi:hypothetical protein